MQEPLTFTKEEINLLHQSIGKNVKRYREEKGLSQLQLSHAIGLSSVSLISAAEIFTKSIHFNVEHLYKIAKVLEIELSLLIDLN